MEIQKHSPNWGTEELGVVSWNNSMMKARKLEPAVIEFKSMRFLITDRPSDINIEKYIEVSHYCVVLEYH